MEPGSTPSGHFGELLSPVLTRCSIIGSGHDLADPQTQEFPEQQ